MKRQVNTDLRSLLSAIRGFGAKRAAATRDPSRPRRDIEHLKARLARQRASAAAARQAVRELEVRLSMATARLDERRRNSLTPEVLANLLPLKAASRCVMGEDRIAAAAREQRLTASSDAYRTICGDEAARQAGLQRLVISGIPWWIPREREAAQRAERAAAQGFPLRAILQTRELSPGDVRAVYAAEPEPSNYACLVQNVCEHGLSGFVLPDQVAIGERRGEITLRQSRYMGGHRVLHTAPRKPVPTVTVPLTTVDAWMERLGVEPQGVSFVKVDTQGSEVTVLRGAGALLAQRRAAWQIEVDPALLQGAGFDVPDLVTLIAAHFTHVIDLGSAGRGPRVRPVAQLAESLAYLGDRAAKTDVLVYNAGRRE